MVKKIATLLLSVSLVAIGLMALNRLSYWERSVWIFKMNDQQNFGRRGFDRGRPNLEGRENRERTARFVRPEIENLPDSVIRQRAENFRREREGSFRGRGFEGERRGRGDFRRGKNVQLSKVSWFLAASALFTVVTIYIDKGFYSLRRKRKAKKTSS